MVTEKKRKVKHGVLERLQSSSDADKSGRHLHQSCRRAFDVRSRGRMRILVIRRESSLWECGHVGLFWPINHVKLLYYLPAAFILEGTFTPLQVRREDYCALVKIWRFKEKLNNIGQEFSLANAARVRRWRGVVVRPGLGGGVGRRVHRWGVHLVVKGVGRWRPWGKEREIIGI